MSREGRFAPERGSPGLDQDQEPVDEDGDAHGLRHGGPPRRVFSAKTIAVTLASAATFIMPRGNMIAQSSQQQPRHQAPWCAPIRRAPSVPSRQEVMMKLIGVRHLVRQSSFNGVSW